MSIRVKRQALRSALCSGPTRNWGSILRHAGYLIDKGTICATEEWAIVDDKAWRDAMQVLHTLPYGGRHVWEARKHLWWAIQRATNPEPATNKE